MNLDEKQTAALMDAIAQEMRLSSAAGISIPTTAANIIVVVKKHLPDPEPIIKTIVSEEVKYTSSISVGTEAKGGQVKIYFNPGEPEEALDRIDNAMVVRGYAKNIVDCATKAERQGLPFPEDTAIAKKFQDIVDKHTERVKNGEFRSNRK